MPQLPDWVRPVADYMFKVGVKHTLEIAAVSVAASAVIGVVLGTLLTIRWLPLRALSRGYIEIWRGLPIVVTIFLMFFALPTLADELHFEALRLTAMNAAIVGLSLWGSAQVAEATRGAVQSIPREQHEAAAALGFGWVGRHLFVVLPQAGKREYERLQQPPPFGSGDPHTFEILGAVLVFFFVISFPLTRLAAYLERRLV